MAEQSSAGNMKVFPSGTVTFLFTDIEGATKLLQQLGADFYGKLLSDQRIILRTSIEEFGGTEIDTPGDGCFVSFLRASDAAAAAAEILMALTDHEWPHGVEVRVRMGLHTGEPLVGDEGYVGLDVHRAARIAQVGYGGQVLISEATAGLLKRDLLEGISLKDLGEYQLKDLRTTWQIYQLVIEGLPSEFPNLKARLAKPPLEPTARKSISLPAFLREDAVSAMGSQPVFVARERELERLDEILEKMLSGQGQVVFISGGPGRGKTALLNHFARRSMEIHKELLVVSGHCDTYTGLGDPYRAFRTALGMLSGDVEGTWAAGAITTDQARRLWGSISVSGGAIAEQGDNLLGTFINEPEFIARVEAAGLEQQDWYIQLQTRLQDDQISGVDLGQVGLFDQVARVLRSVAEKWPLIITLDDLQWADRGSLDLLVHLGTDLAGARILVLGTFRSEEVALGRDGERHPLEKVLAEFKRQYGEIELDLGVETTVEGRAFVDTYLEIESNRLSEDFHQALFEHTEGHPLFTVELLRAMQERGDLVRDEEELWMEGPTLDWETLPAQVEGVIEERIDRLEDELREILTIASVEGEDFTAQVIAWIQEADEWGLVRKLSGELDRKHRLVGEQGSQQVGKVKLFLYRFRHSLFQQHLYNGLSGNEKEILHREVGAVLEALYGKEVDKIANQLARHFSKAREAERALPYLLGAGDRARQLLAYREAVEFYEQALTYQKESGKFEEAAGTLMRLGLTHQAVYDFRRARQAFEESFDLRRQAPASSLADLPPAPHPLRLFWGLSRVYDPGIPNSVSINSLLRQLFSGLLSYGPNWTIQPEVARAWAISDDGLRYIFHLRDDVFWTDGQPVTADDFEFAWKRILDPRIAAKSPDMIYAIKGARAFNQGETTDPALVAVHAVDPYTLEVELVEPATYFLTLLTIPKMFPVPRHIVERYGKAWTEPMNLVTNGPFRLQELTLGENITLVRNPTYFGRFRGNLAQVDFLDDSELSQAERLIAYRAGQVDILALVMENYYARHQLAAEYQQTELTATNHLGFGLLEPPFHDRRVRQAFALTIDKEYLAKEILNGRDLPATGGFLPPGFPGHSPGIGLPFDPDKAKLLLAEAGYPDGRGFPPVDLPEVNYGPKLETARIFVWFWDKYLGIQVNIKAVAPVDYDTDYSQKLIFLSEWVPSHLDPLFFMRSGVQYFSRNWQHPGYEQLIQKAVRIADPAERIELYRQADRILMEEAVIVPTVYSVSHYLVKPWVKIADLTLHYPTLKDVIIEPH